MASKSIFPLSESRAVRLPAEAEIRFVTGPAPLVPLDRLMRIFPREPAFFWSPHPDTGRCAIGSVETWQLESGTGSIDGMDRFTMARRVAETLFRRVMVIADDDAPKPCLVGGFSFSPESVQDPIWREFGSVRLVLPRWTYIRDKERAWLSLAFCADARERDQGLWERASLLRQLAEMTDPTPDSDRHETAAWVNRTSLIAFSDLVRKAQATIHAGLFNKVVVAQRGTVFGSLPFDPCNLLNRLADRALRCIRFAHRIGSTTFLGVTPERLVTKRHREVLSEALAGTVASPPGREGERPIFGPKDRAEHRWVVDEIVRVLGSYCSQLTIPPTPTLLKLVDLWHLHTPIIGTLSQETHVLELIGALHPTPAVGGVPTREAQKWIIAHEPHVRGWYASPIGWFDASGDGEFAVALRCALLDGKAAYVYAGAGIIDASQAELEYQETLLKQQSIAAALGLCS